MKSIFRFILIVFAFVTAGLGAGAVDVVASQKPREYKVKIRDTQLFVSEIGKGTLPVLLILHGGPGGNHSALLPLSRFASRFRVIFYDQRGTGESDRLPIDTSEIPDLSRLTLNDNVEDIEALRKTLGVTKINILGHSWGGALAIFYAAKYPKNVETLVVYSGGPETPNMINEKKINTNKNLTTDELMQMQVNTNYLMTAIRDGQPQDKLDQLFLDVVAITFPVLYCKRPVVKSTPPGRGGFWANQGALQYVSSFDPKSFSATLNGIKVRTLLTRGKCEPSPVERQLYLLDHMSNARFVEFEFSSHNAMEEESDLFFKTLEAFWDQGTYPTAIYNSRQEYTGRTNPTR